MLGLAATLALVSIANPTPERRALKLLYEVDAALVRDCPGASTFLDSLSARLGYVPPDEASAPLARIRIEPRGGGLVGRVELERGGEPVVSEVAAGPTECRAVVDALALKLALALDPFQLSPPPPRVETATVATSTPARSHTPRIYRRVVPRRIVRPRPPIYRRLRVEAGGTLPLFALPSTPAYGFFGAFGFQYTRGFETDVSFIGLIPSGKRAGEGRISAYSLLGRVDVCGRAGGFAFCAIVTAGATLGGGRGFAVDERGSALQLGGGTQIAYDFEIADGFGIRLSVTGEALAVRARLKVDEETLWTMPPAHVEIALSHWVSW